MRKLVSVQFVAFSAASTFEASIRGRASAHATRTGHRCAIVAEKVVPAAARDHPTLAYSLRALYLEAAGTKLKVHALEDLWNIGTPLSDDCVHSPILYILSAHAHNDARVRSPTHQRGAG